ncbi:pleiotropic drug resistance protein 3-like protein [Corchorus olitorius]|uniref:Pleiotropic drug resistance protein 3-like protein n=1 Tax=Corchorus olitorius TaxID=93759 RepID=A0A1R3KQQ7_9ROSI|nr:pleiotropic drug resistance protein 3-like protein [Corchorus olitorius]
MAQSQRVVADDDEIESFRINDQLSEIGRSLRSSFRIHASSFRSSSALRFYEALSLLPDLDLSFAKLPMFDIYFYGFSSQAISVQGLKRNLQTDYILKILGLDICADTLVGDAMVRGISGGQKKRLTTVDTFETGGTHNLLRTTREAFK